MSSLFEKYCHLFVNGEVISLEQQNTYVPFFCYPINARPIGFEGCVMYCFIDGYGDMVFAANPESCADQYVYPLAESFEDFMRLILCCGTANPIEQIVWMDKQQFAQHLQEEKKNQTQQQKQLLNLLARELNLIPIETPFEYVKAIQSNFNDSKIKYSDEYYEVLGIDDKI